MMKACAAGRRRRDTNVNKENKSWLLRGFRDGTPIMLGYLAVAFTLGIAARSAGLTALEATLTSLLNNASAGEYAGFTVMRADGGYWEMALMMLVTNARYLLMSCALSQKLSPDTGIGCRLLIGYGVTDEIFGADMSVRGSLNPRYHFGMFLIASAGWAVGTCLGVMMGNLLPARLTSALSVGLYGMFLAIIVPPARKDRVILGLVCSAMVLSFTLSRLCPALGGGMRVILLTVALSCAAAALFPVREEEARYEA